MNYNDLAELLFPDVNSITYYEEFYKERKERFVTRFAPSPTGFLHLGSLYTAYIASLFSKQNNGVMLLRIEDTDSKREVENAVDQIIKDLSDFDINIDEGISNGNYGPYIQSERTSIYHSYVKYLILQGLAYPCFLTSSEIDDIRKQQEENKERIGIYGKYAYSRDLSIDEIRENIKNKKPYVIRLKSPGDFSSKVECMDLIKGKIEFPCNDLDIVLLKSDMVPTYHLAHVIDDHLMKVTHVIRGEEWLSSLPIHYQLFRIFDFKIPKYAHISPITKKDGNGVRKLSKRKDKECLVSYYDELGIPSDVIKLYFNTLINPDYEQWYNSKSDNEFIFSFKKMPTGGTLFDMLKLTSISKTYFSRMSADDLLEQSLNYYKKYDGDFYNVLCSNKEYALNIFNIERNVKKPRKDIMAYSDIKKMYWYFFDCYYDTYNNWNYDIDISLIEKYISIYDYDSDNERWYNTLKQLASDNGYCCNVKEYNINPSLYKGHIGHVCTMIRYILTTLYESPDIYEIMRTMGQDRVLKRFNDFLNSCKTK